MKMGLALQRDLMLSLMSYKVSDEGNVCSGVNELTDTQSQGEHLN